MQRKLPQIENGFPRFFTLEMSFATISALSALVLAWSLLMPGGANTPVLLVSGLIFTISLVVVVRFAIDPDSIRARQTSSMLQLASQTLDHMTDGMTYDAAQAICRLLLPNTAACAIAITDLKVILGYAGLDEQDNTPGTPVHTQATRATLADGEIRYLHSAEEIGFPANKQSIQGAIVMPLRIGNNVAGVLKFYYRRGRQITETQRSIAEGFRRLLSTQMTALELENQRQLMTAMELKMLQSQINPHFLFNTINTISSFIRTDPMKARELLREFAVFYRRLLENASELIPLEREIEQTERYFMFEEARFGPDRVELKVEADDRFMELEVPPFIIQPLVENAVHHALPVEGKLTIRIIVEKKGDDIVVHVRDDGVGMSGEVCDNILHPSSTNGLGIAMKNVYDRMKGYYGDNADVEVTSAIGKGTDVILVFPEKAVLGGRDG